uniref:PsbP C-terminal domain-containing protein n=1 Tax=Glycine max TaxID=3847 RepID=A0A0R0EQD0_SOYBN
MGMAVQPRGITSFLLGLPPQSGRNLKLDVLYPIGGYSRCVDTKEGFYAAKKREMERSLDPPPLNQRRRSNINEPVVAFGPPGSTGENSLIEAFGGPDEVGEAVDFVRNVKYYELEFRVESPSFRRHNVSVCCARGGRLFTLNAQAPEAEWPGLKSDFYRIANSFSLTT